MTIKTSRKGMRLTVVLDDLPGTHTTNLEDAVRDAAERAAQQDVVKYWQDTEHRHDPGKHGLAMNACIKCGRSGDMPPHTR